MRRSNATLELYHHTSRGLSQAAFSSSPPGRSDRVLPHSAVGIPLPRDAISGYPKSPIPSAIQ